MSELLELILSYRDYYGAYHHHKEQMAFAGAGLYLAGTTALYVQGISSPVPANVCVILTLSVIGAYTYVVWQFQKRHFGAVMVKACTSVAADELKTPSTGPVEWEVRNTLKWPKPLALAIDQVPDGIRGGRVSEWVTYLAMLLWTGAAANRLGYL